MPPTATNQTNCAGAATPPSSATVALARTPRAELTATEQAALEQSLRRIEGLPTEFGWLLVYVGVLGVILPGVIGFPLVIAGGAVVMPGGRKWLSRWAARRPGPFVRASLKQIDRLVEDIERRYPRHPAS